jgi:hypothetical protein
MQLCAEFLLRRCSCDASRLRVRLIGGARLWVMRAGRTGRHLVELFEVQPLESPFMHGVKERSRFSASALHCGEVSQETLGYLLGS